MDGQVRAKKLIVRLVKCLSENIRRLVDKRNKPNLMASEGDLLTDKVIIQLNVAGTSMKDRVCSHIGGAKIITVNKDRKVKVNTRLMQ
ncbi:unnamed protein product [Prunus armeniaca]